MTIDYKTLDQQAAEARAKREEYYRDTRPLRPRTCARPSCENGLIDRMVILCDVCQADLDGTLAEIVAIQAKAKKERLARQGAQS